MNYEYQQTPFSKALFTGLFCGLAATLASLLYSFIFKFTTGYTLSTIVNVPIIIFFSLLTLVVCGLLFSLFKRITNGTALFIIIFVSLTAFGLWKISGVNRSPDPQVAVQFRELLSGIILIAGVCAFFLIPFLYNNKKFEENVL